MLAGSSCRGRSRRRRSLSDYEEDQPGRRDSSTISSSPPKIPFSRQSRPYSHCFSARNPSPKSTSSPSRGPSYYKGTGYNSLSFVQNEDDSDSEKRSPTRYSSSENSFGTQSRQHARNSPQIQNRLARRNSNRSQSRPRLPYSPSRLHSKYSLSPSRSPSPEPYFHYACWSFWSGFQSLLKILEMWCRSSIATVLARSGWIDADRPAECFIDEETGKPMYSFAEANGDWMGKRVRGFRKRQAWKVGICYRPWRPVSWNSNKTFAHWGVYICPLHSRRVCSSFVQYAFNSY